MRTETKMLTVRDLVGMLSGEGGEELSLSAEHQRQEIWTDRKKTSVIGDILEGIPVGTVYVLKTGEDAFEVMDGRQRLSAILDFARGKIAMKVNRKPKKLENYSKEEQENFYGFQIETVFCQGNADERNLWFERLNDQGTNLSAQEIRNCLYSGRFTDALTEAFVTGKNDLAPLIEEYTPGPKLRGKGLETALGWAAAAEGKSINDYMSEHHRDTDADGVIEHFRRVCAWVRENFIFYRQEERKVPWGELYLRCRDMKLNPPELERRVHELMMNPDVTRKEGIYTYVLTGDEKALSIRLFNRDIKREVYEEQGHRCGVCGEEFALEDMEADHIVPWALGGRTVRENCRLLCRECHQNRNALETRAA